MVEEILERVRQCMLDGDIKGAPDCVRVALDAGIPPLRIIDEGLVRGMQEVGKKFESGEYYLPELMMGARAMEAAMAVAQAAIQEAGQERQALGTVVLGTVEGDIHDIGKNLVALLLRVNGFAVHDLGTSVPAAQFVDAARNYNADVVGLSALLTVTMSKQRDVIQALRSAGLSKPPKVIVGGAPINQEWADRIGADAYSPDALTAVRDIKKLLPVAIS